MTKLETIVTYAQKNLSEKEQDLLADEALKFMHSLHGNDMRLSPEEIEDVKFALADPNPKYASDEDVIRVLGRLP